MVSRVPRRGRVSTSQTIELCLECHCYATVLLLAGSRFWKTRVEPFTEKQIKLITTFSDQAVIAIENARLFEAERQRTRRTHQSLDQQTATSEVLKVIFQFAGRA